MTRSSFLWRVAASLSVPVLAGCGGTNTDTAPTFRYAVSPLAKLPFVARLVARNPGGTMIGYREAIDSDGFLLSPDGALTLLADPPGFTRTELKSISRAGKVLGLSTRFSPAEVMSFVYDFSTGDLSRISGLSYPSAINNSGQVIGLLYEDVPSSSTRSSKGIVIHLATNTAEMLPDKGGNTYFSPTVISDSGLVIGNIIGDTAGPMVLYDTAAKLQRTVPAGMYPDAFALFITDTGIVSGYDSLLDYNGPSPMRAFLYDLNSGVRTYLPALPSMAGGVRTFPVNASGQAAVETFAGSFVYRDRQIQEINSTLSASDKATWTLRQTFAIEDSGVIYAAAEQKDAEDASTTTYVVRLTPQ